VIVDAPLPYVYLPPTYFPHLPPDEFSNECGQQYEYEVNPNKTIKCLANIILPTPNLEVCKMEIKT
jgi:hypothetical protein